MLRAKIAPTRDDVLDVIHKRSAKRFAYNFLNALKHAVEAMKRLRNEAKNYLGYLKIESKSDSGWKPKGGVEEDYAAIVVTGAMAQGRVHLITFLVNRMRGFNVNGPTVDRLTKSAMLYLREIMLIEEKAKQMIHAHYDKGEGDVKEE